MDFLIREYVQPHFTQRDFKVWKAMLLGLDKNIVACVSNPPKMHYL